MGVVKRWVLRGLWRRLVGVGIIGPGLLGAPAFILSLAALGPLRTWCGPSLCARSHAARPAFAHFGREWGTPLDGPPFPLLVPIIPLLGSCLSMWV